MSKPLTDAQNGNGKPHHWQRYPKYKPSGVEWLGEVPVGWGTKRLKFTTNLTNKKVDPTKTEIPYIGLENIESWTGRYIPSEDPVEMEGLSNHFKKGDVLLGKLRPYLAKVLKATGDGICTSELLVLHPKLVHQNFLFYYLISRDFITTIDSSTYGAKMPRANWDFIGNLPSLIPFSLEQTAIAAFLDRETSRIDALIEKKEQQIELLQEKRAALISHAVTKGLDPNVKLKDSGVEWLGEVPEGWIVKKLKYLADIRGRIGWRTLTTEDYVDEGPILLGVRNILSNNHLSFEDLTHIPVEKYDESPEIKVQENDILLAKTGATIGKSCVVPKNEYQLTVNAAVNILRPSHDVLPAFLNYLISANPLQHQMFSNIAFNARGNLFQENISNIFGLFTDISEQLAIAAFLDRETAKIDDLIRLINESMEKIREYRSALISAGVTGKIDVRGEVPETIAET
jgi:type I restriction enzyme S subunit